MRLALFESIAHACINTNFGDTPMTTILIILVLFLLLGGGGYWGFRGRR
jgi:hypothetical protein